MATPSRPINAARRRTRHQPAKHHRVLGATWALDGVWRSLGLDTLLARLLGQTRCDVRTERVLFGLVAARAIEPASKLATAAWLTRRTHIAGLTDGETGAQVSDDACDRAMDWLIEAAPQAEQEVFWSVASLHRPRGRPAFVRHHQHLLRDRRRRRTGAA